MYEPHSSSRWGVFVSLFLGVLLAATSVSSQESRDTPKTENAEIERLQKKLAEQIKKVGKDHWTVTDIRLIIQHHQIFQKLSPTDRAELDQASGLNRQVVQFYRQREYAKAIRLADQVREVRLHLLGKKHLSYVTSLTTLASLYNLTGEYAKAESLYKQALEIHKEVLGQKHPSYATSLTALAVLYDSMGEYAKAEPLYKQAMEIHKEVLGEKDSSYATILNGLAVLYVSMGQYAKAEPLHKQALEIRKDVLGEKHPSYAVSLHNLATLYSSLGEYVKAEPLYKQALGIRKEVFGEKHPYYAISLNDLAMLYYSIEEYAKAEPLYKQALEIRKEVFGEKHSSYAASLHNLAGLYRSMGECAKAEPLYKQAMEIHKEVLGENHSNYATSLNALAVLYDLMGEYEKAEPLYKQALEIYKEVLGEKHPSYAVSLYGLAGLYNAMGEYAKAEPLYKRALKIRKEVLREKHPDYATNLNGLASLYYLMGDYAKAEPLYKQALEIHKEVLGENNPSYAASLNNLASLYSSIGDYTKAEPLYKQALEIHKEVLGENNPSYAVSLNNLAEFYSSTGEHAKAESLHNQAVEIRKKILGAKHPDYAISLNNLADLYASIGEYAKAEPLYNQAMEIHKEVLGEKHPSYAASLNNMAVLHVLRGEYAKAEPLRQQAMEIHKEVLGEKHPSYAVSMNSLAFLYYSKGEYRKVEPLYKRALEIRKEVLGEKHPDYATSLKNLAHLYHSIGEYGRAEPFYKQSLIHKLEFVRLTTRSQSEASARRLVQSQSLEPGPLLSVARHLPEQKPGELYDLVFSGGGLMTAMVAERRHVSQDSERVQELYQQLQQTSRQLAQLTLATVPPKQQEHRQKRLQELNDQKEDLERQLAAESREFRQEQAIENAMPKDLMQRLHSAVAVVDLMEVSIPHPPKSGRGELEWTREYEAFVLRKVDTAEGYTVAWVHLGSAKEINDAITQWLRQIDQEQDQVTSPDHPSQFLRTRLWDKLQPHLKGISHAVILPDSQLCFLPWAALPGEKPGTFLLEDITLSTALNGQELYRQLIASPEEKSELLLVGGVNYDNRTQQQSSGPDPTLLANRAIIRRSPAVDSDKRPRWPFLPGTEQEAKTLQNLWLNAENSTVLIDTSANEAALQTAMPQAKYIHLATHGFFADAKFRSAFQHDPNQEQLFAPAEMELLSKGRATVTGRNPLILSGVVLAGANLPPIEDDLGLPTGEDGVLTAQEVIHLDLRGTELVTLSACDTGRGTEVAGGEGIYGLQRAFHLAGAKHVVASLWKVDDQATAALMKLFYHHLWKENQHPATALRNAQLTLLRHPEEISKLAGADPKQLGELAGSLRALDLSASVPLPEDEKPKSVAKRPPIRLWAAFTHSGPPVPMLVP